MIPVKNVVVLSLGGTIAMVAPSTGGPVVPALDAADLLQAVPGLAECGVNVEVADVRRVPGASLTIEDLHEVVRAAADRVRDGAAGFVVTQGTDTIEETAFALDLLWSHEEPLVVTGAMRHAAMAGADGPANLLAAVRIAASVEARGLGCLVVMADEIHAARWVRKTHTASVSTFASPSTGPLGYLAEGTMMTFWRPPGRRASVPTGNTRAAARVALITATLGDDGELLHGLADRFAGVVVAGFGVGHLPANWVDTVADLAARIPVVLASRIGVGPILANTYGFPGSESDLLARGLISARWLDAYKARILLQVLLASGADRTLVAKTFATYTNTWRENDG